jgi:hypothetical protein
VMVTGSRVRLTANGQETSTCLYVRVVKSIRLNRMDKGSTIMHGSERCRTPS